MTESNTLLLTGQTKASRFIVLVGEDRIPIPIPESRFIGLLVLVDAKINRSSGRAELRDFESSGVAFEKAHLHQLIRRLRLDFSVALGCDGSGLVVHEGRSRYSLSISRHDIVIAPDFLELETDLPRDLFLRLKKVVQDLHTAHVSKEASALSVLPLSM